MAQRAGGAAIEGLSFLNVNTYESGLRCCVRRAIVANPTAHRRDSVCSCVGKNGQKCKNRENENVEKMVLSCSLQI